MINNIPGGIESNTQDQYPFDEGWILQQKFTWEQSISLSANRKFTQFAMINQPDDPNPTQDNTNQVSYYVNGPYFKAKASDDDEEAENTDHSVPFYQKFPNDAIVAHGRNAIIKDQLFYNVLCDHVVKTYCVRLDQEVKGDRVKCFNINISKHLSEHDCWLQ